MSLVLLYLLQSSVFAFAIPVNVFRIWKCNFFFFLFEYYLKRDLLHKICYCGLCICCDALLKKYQMTSLHYSDSKQLILQNPKSCTDLVWFTFTKNCCLYYFCCRGCGDFVSVFWIGKKNTRFGAGLNRVLNDSFKINGFVTLRFPTLTTSLGLSSTSLKSSSLSLSFLRSHPWEQLAASFYSTGHWSCLRVNIIKSLSLSLSGRRPAFSASLLIKIQPCVLLNIRVGWYGSLTGHERLELRTRVLGQHSRTQAAPGQRCGSSWKSSPKTKSVLPVVTVLWGERHWFFFLLDRFLPAAADANLTIIVLTTTRVNWAMRRRFRVPSDERNIDIW